MKPSGINYSSLIIIILIMVYVTNFSFLGIEAADNFGLEKEVHMGLILDMESREGKIVHRCILMAIEDFYDLHNNYSTRLELHVRDSKGEPLNALSAAFELVDDIKIKAIIGGQTRLEAGLLAELGEKVKVPVLSLSKLPISSQPSKGYSYLIHIAQDGILQFKCMASIIESFKWGDVILIYEDIDFEREIIFMMHVFKYNSIYIKQKSILSSSYTDEQVIEELYKLKSNKTSQNEVFVVHISSNDIMNRLLINAQKLGMMSEEYIWFMSASTMNLMPLMNIESMIQGVVVGLKPNIPLSQDLDNLSEYGISAYDSTWALAKAFERTRSKIYQSISNKNVHQNSLNGLDKIMSLKYDFVFMKEILRSKFMGLSDHEVEFINRTLEYLKEFELVNVIGKARKRVGIWTYSKDQNKGTYRGRHLLNYNDFDYDKAINKAIGRSLTNLISKRRFLSSEINLKIIVPMKSGFTELVKVNYYDKSKNVNNIVTGFCVEVFKAALSILHYHNHVKCHYDLSNKSYSDLVYAVYLEEYDAVVGDVTITSNRTNYVDFTQPFTDLGIGVVVKNDDDKNMWIFVNPLSPNLWITTIVLFIITGIIVWIIERNINKAFQGSFSHQLGMIFWFSFSTLVFAHREKLKSNLSKFVVIVWVFVVLILTSSYTATLSSMLTVKRIGLNSKGNYIGYQSFSLISHRGFNNLNFKGAKLYSSPEDYARAFSKGSKHGGVSAIIDEIPYIKIFLAMYPNDYTMINYKSATNGFGFAFRKGSPMVDDMSWAIAKLREEGELERLEELWFHPKADLTWQNPSNYDQNILTLERFGGLFLISGISSALALILYLAFFLKEKWSIVKTCIIQFLTNFGFIR